MLDRQRLVTIGATIRSVRNAIGMSQRRLAARVGRSQSFISRVEAGRVGSIRVSDLDRLCRGLGATLVLGVEEPLVLGGARQRDAAHAVSIGHVVRRLSAAGWLVEREVEIGPPGRPGWIDVLAFHPESGVLLVIEVKSELRDLGELERQIGWYQSEAIRAARRFGWSADVVLGSVLLLATDTNDRRLLELGATLRSAFPLRARDLAAVVEGGRPSGSARALAMIDPRSRARRWCRPTRLDGRRTTAPYRDYRDFVAAGRPRRRMP
jgi:transcriptional regulator with XRE-family HTH domain